MPSQATAHCPFSGVTSHWRHSREKGGQPKIQGVSEDGFGRLEATHIQLSPCCLLAQSPQNPVPWKAWNRSDTSWEVLTKVRCRECNRSPGLQQADVTPGLINSAWFINLSLPAWGSPKLPAEATKLSVEPSGVARITSGTQRLGSCGFKVKGEIYGRSSSL